jgi:hypothetical protein
VANAGFARKGFLLQQFGQIIQLASRSAALYAPIYQSGNACGIIPTVLQPAQAFEHNGGCMA